MTIQRIAVLGGGAWGTALALTCARAGRQVVLWEYDADNAACLAQKRESRYLSGVRLDNSIKVTRNLGETTGSEAILVVVPAQAVRSVITALAPSVFEEHSADRLCQGHRARHSQVHDRDHRRVRADGIAGNPVGTEFRG